MPRAVTLVLALAALLRHAPCARAADAPSPGNALTFELPYGQRKCFTEDLAPSTTTRGTVHVASGTGEMTLDLFVSDARGVVHFHKADVGSVKFSFRTAPGPAHVREMYRFCVVNQVHPHAAGGAGRTVRRVTLRVEEVQERGELTLGRIAKQEHVDKVYSSFLSVSSDVDGLIEKMEELRAKEQTLSEVNERTATTILRISLIACIFTIGTGVLNFLSLKTFFKRKKLA